MSTRPLQGLAYLLLFQVAGELLARALSLPLPGPVIGMLLLLVALRLPAIRTPVAICAEFLLAHLSLLFVPVGVGVISHLDLISTFGGRILVVIVLSTWAGMLATVWVLSRLPEVQPPAPATDSTSTDSTAARSAATDSTEI